MIPIAYSSVYPLELPEGHRFPMIKYELLAEQLLYEGTIEKEQFFNPGPLSLKHMYYTHDPEYWEALSNFTLSKKAVRKIGFPLTQTLLDRGRVIANGTLKGSMLAIKNRSISLNIAGGTHHAFSDSGGGFCVLNDIAIASHVLLREQGISQILIIDLDVHQGDGTAYIFEKNSQVFTFSMHGANNYPMEKMQSDLDIGLPDGIKDKAYLDCLKQILPTLLDAVKPDFCFYLSGVDVLECDQLGKLSLTISGCKERDRVVLTEIRNRNIPINVSMGGGYSKQIRNIIEAHANTFRVAQELYS